MKLTREILAQMLEIYRETKNQSKAGTPFGLTRHQVSSLLKIGGALDNFNYEAAVKWGQNMRREFSPDEKRFIEKALRDGLTQWEIGKNLGRGASGVKHEIQRNKGIDGKYCAETAIKRAQEKTHANGVMTDEKLEILEDCVKKGWSKARMAHELNVSDVTVGKWIEKLELPYERGTYSNEKRLISLESKQDFLIEQMKIIVETLTKEKTK